MVSRTTSKPSKRFWARRFVLIASTLVLALAGAWLPVGAFADEEPPKAQLYDTYDLNGVLANDIRFWFVTDDAKHAVVTSNSDSSYNSDSVLTVINLENGDTDRLDAIGAISLSNDIFLYRAYDSDFYIYNYETGSSEAVGDLDVDDNSSLLFCALAPDGRSLRLATGDRGDYSYDAYVYNLDTQEATEKVTIPAGNMPQQGCIWITDDLKTAMVSDYRDGGGDSVITAYDMETGNELYTTRNDVGVVGFYAQADNTTLLAYNMGSIARVNIEDGKVELFTDLTNSTVQIPSYLFTDSLSYAPKTSVLVTTDGKANVLSGSLSSDDLQNVDIAVYDNATGEQLWETNASLDFGTESNGGVATSDGRYFYTFISDNDYADEIAVVDMKTGASTEFDIDGGPMELSYLSWCQIALSEDASKLVVFDFTPDEDASISVYDTGIAPENPLVAMVSSGSPVLIIGIVAGVIALVVIVVVVVLVLKKRKKSQSTATGAQPGGYVPPISAPTEGVPASTPPANAAAGPRFCPHCGNRLVPGAQFCSNCGKPVHTP